MPSKKIKFVDKKRDATYQLQPRGQTDPLIVDPHAPQNVLCPAPGSKVEFSDMRSESTVGKLRRWQKESNFGIGFKDGYDYMQHIKDAEKPENFYLPIRRSGLVPLKEEIEEQTPMMVNGKQHHHIPTIVFPSEVEAEKSLLHKDPEQGLMVDMDHEIREMLDDDFNDYDEVEKFEDVKDKIKDEKDECELGDIIKELHLDENALDSDADSRAGDFNSDDDNAFDGSDDGNYAYSDNEFDSGDDFMDRQTIFSKMSMQSASVMRRNEGLQMVDRKFDVGRMRLMHGNGFGENIEESEKYGVDDVDQGIDCEDFIEQELKKFRPKDLEKLDEQSKKVILAKFTNERDADEDLVNIYKKVTPQHDCKSILSTYSNIYNHAKRIDLKAPEKKKEPKNAVVQNSQDLKETSVEKISHPTPYELSQRNKNETKEEKKERQKAFKAAKKARRVEKKENQNKWKDAQKKRKGEVQVLIEKNPQNVKL